jgi:hypothetical protein
MKNQGPESLRPDRGLLRRSISSHWPRYLHSVKPDYWREWLRGIGQAIWPALDRMTTFWPPVSWSHQPVLVVVPVRNHVATRFKRRVYFVRF